MPDRYNYRDLEQTEKKQWASVEKTVAKKEFQGECTMSAPGFMCRSLLCPSSTEDWSAQATTEDWSAAPTAQSTKWVGVTTKF